MRGADTETWMPMAVRAVERGISLSRTLRGIATTLGVLGVLGAALLAAQISSTDGTDVGAERATVFATVVVSLLVTLLPMAALASLVEIKALALWRDLMDDE